MKLKIFLIIIIVILISGGIGLYIGYNTYSEPEYKEEKKKEKEDPIDPEPDPDLDDPNYKDIESFKLEYLKYNQELELNDANYSILSVVKTKEEYDEFLNSYNIEIYEDENNKGYDDAYQYVMLVVEVDSCSEQVTPRKYMVVEDTLLINTRVVVNCGVCALEQELFIIPIPKEEVFNRTILKFDYKAGTECDPDVAYKPVLYLYPEKDTDVDVTFAYPELLTTTYPKYNNGWHVTAKQTGDLLLNNKSYYALYWEEETSSKVDFNEGFYVTKDNAIEFLEDKLTIIGLTPREQNEFIMYWLPILEKNGENLVYFELTDSLQKANALNITPTPDSLLRVRIHVKKVDNKVNIKEQILPTFERTGFTAVEWGGVIY